MNVVCCRCYKQKLICQEENNNQTELSLEKQSLSERKDLLNDIIDIKLHQVESKREKEKVETESEEIERKYEDLRQTLAQTELQLSDLKEKKLIIEKELELKRKEKEDLVLSSKQLKEENTSQKVEIAEMKKMQEQEQMKQKSNLQSKDDIIRELTLSMEAQKEQEKKKSKNSVKYLKEKKYFEEKLVVKDGEISMWKTSYNQAQKELARMKTSLEGLYSENYFFLYIIFVLLFVISGLI